jgi:quinol monooxygenase YgiN
MNDTTPVPTLVTYRPKEGAEAQFLALLEKHWPALDAAGLVTNDRPQIWRATAKDGKVSFVEIFSWKDRTSSDVAHQTPAVMAVWEPMGAILEGMQINRIEPVDFRSEGA